MDNIIGYPFLGKKGMIIMSVKKEERNSTKRVININYKSNTDTYLDREINPHKESLKIAIAYAIISVLWIFSSGEILYLISNNIATIKNIELYKGSFYVAITVSVVYKLIKNRLIIIKATAEEIEKAYEELNSSYRALTHTEKILEEGRYELESQRSALEVSEQRYKLAVEGSRDKIWKYDVQSSMFSVISTKKSIEEELNVENELSFSKWKESIHPEDREKAVFKLQEYLYSGKGIYKDTYRIQNKYKSYKWIFSRGKAVFNKNGKVIGINGFYTDVTEQVKLKENKEITDNIFDNAPIVICLLDLNGKIVKCNKYAGDVTGYEYEHLIGTMWIDKFILKEHKEDMKKLFAKLQNGQLVSNFEEEFICKNGQSVNMLWTNSFLYKNDGNVKSILSIGVDITRQKYIEKSLHHISYYNKLTELPNRILFESEAKKLLENSLYSNIKMALVYLDIDNLKYINDAVGYGSGDKLLQYTSSILKHYIKKPNLIAHMSGDEFVVLFYDILDDEDIISKVKNLQRALNRSWFLEKQEVYITSSIGVALYPEHGEEIGMLLKNAETAMYFIKDVRRGGYNIYSETMAKEALEFNWMVNELRKAIKNKEFILYYQPLINLDEYKIIGVEALIRWNHPIKGFISPAEFIPIAEASGLIVDIGEWIFEEACRQKKIWNDKGYYDIKVSINLSGRELTNEGLFAHIKQIIEKYSIEYSSIQVEITETAVMVDLNSSIPTLNELKSLGIKIALDDFGTGYSSLNYLKVLPIDVIKLDGSFVKSIQDKNQREEIITTVIQLGHILNLQVLSEGIETKEQMIFLRNNNCDLGQGYLFGRPLPVDELEGLLKSNEGYILNNIFKEL